MAISNAGIGIKLKVTVNKINSFHIETEVQYNPALLIAQTLCAIQKKLTNIKCNYDYE